MITYPNPDQYDTMAEDNSLLKKSHYGGTPRNSGLQKSFKDSKWSKYVGLLTMIITLIIIATVVTYNLKKAAVVKPTVLLTPNAPNPTNGVQWVEDEGNTAVQFMDMVMEGDVISNAIDAEEEINPTFDRTNVDKVYKEFLDDSKIAGEKLVNMYNEITDNKTEYTNEQLAVSWRDYKVAEIKSKQALKSLITQVNNEVSSTALATVKAPEFFLITSGIVSAGIAAAGLGTTWVSNWYG